MGLDGVPFGFYWGAWTIAWGPWSALIRQCSHSCAALLYPRFFIRIPQRPLVSVFMYFQSGSGRVLKRKGEHILHNIWSSKPLIAVQLLHYWTNPIQRWTSHIFSIFSPIATFPYHSLEIKGKEKKKKFINLSFLHVKNPVKHSHVNGALYND